MTTIATATPHASAKSAPAARKIVRLSDLRVGERALVAQLDFVDQGCRRRFAEMGLYEGATVTITADGDTMMVAIGTSRMGVSAHCAASVIVLRLA